MAKESTRINGLDCGLDSVQIYPSGCDIDYLASPGAAWVAIEMDEETFQRVALKRKGRPLGFKLTGALNLPVPRAVRQELERMVESSFSESVSPNLWIEPIMTWVVDLLDATESKEIEPMARRLRHRNELLRRSEDYLRSQLGKPFDSKALAKFVGVTERCLQKYYQEAYGMSPGQWSRCLSLHLARKLLLECDPGRFTVESVAREVGFRHMGRFAGSYEELFGEFPSATLGRVRLGGAGHRPR